MNTCITIPQALRQSSMQWTPRLVLLNFTFCSNDSPRIAMYSSRLHGNHPVLPEWFQIQKSTRNCIHSVCLRKTDFKHVLTILLQWSWCLCIKGAPTDYKPSSKNLYWCARQLFLKYILIFYGYGQVNTDSQEISASFLLQFKIQMRISESYASHGSISTGQKKENPIPLHLYRRQKLDLLLACSGAAQGT